MKGSRYISGGYWLMPCLPINSWKKELEREKLSVPFVAMNLRIAFMWQKIVTLIRALAFASKWGCRIDFWKVNDTKSWMNCCLNAAKETLVHGLNPVFITTSLIYSAWLCRNGLCLRARNAFPSQLANLKIMLRNSYIFMIILRWWSHARIVNPICVVTSSVRMVKG